MRNREFGPSGEHEINRIELLEDIIISLGILGPSRNYRDIFEVLPDSSRASFQQIIFSNPSYGQNSSEMVDSYLTSLPLSYFVEKDNGRYALSELGSMRFDVLMNRYLEYTELKPELNDMISRAVNLAADRLQ